MQMSNLWKPFTKSDLKFNNFGRALGLLAPHLLFNLFLYLFRLNLLQSFKNKIIFGIGFAYIFRILIGRDHNGIGFLSGRIAVASEMPYGSAKTATSTIWIYPLIILRTLTSQMSGFLAYIACCILET